MRKFFAKLAIPAIVAVISILGTLLTQQYLQVKAKPNLRKDILRTDLSGLTPDIRKQIGLVPINYTLQNISRSTAQNVSVFVKADSLLTIQDLKFSQESEDHQVGMADPHAFKINAPSIRPNGLLSFQILTTASNNLTFSELSDNANFITTKGSEATQSTGNSYFGWAVVLFVVLLWLPIIGILVYVFWQAGKVWRNLETSETPPEIKTKLIVLLIALYIYDSLIIGSTSILQAWLPLPRIRFDELISIFLLYLLITRYRLVEQWIKVMIEKHRKRNDNPPA